MKINYGIYKITKGKKKTIHSMNGSIEGDFDWELDEDHRKIRKLIQEKHPGYSIHGYCIAN